MSSMDKEIMNYLKKLFDLGNLIQYSRPQISNQGLRRIHNYQGTLKVWLYYP